MTVSIPHDNATFSEFYQKYKDNDLSEYNMDLKKFQKYYIRSLFKSNVANDINTAKNTVCKKVKIKYPRK